MKDKLKAIACLGLAVCVASGLWACSREDVQTEPESSNTTINYVYNGIYDISNIPEETLSGEMPVTEIVLPPACFGSLVFDFRQSG